MNVANHSHILLQFSLSYFPPFSLTQIECFDYTRLNWKTSKTFESIYFLQLIFWVPLLSTALYAQGCVFVKAYFFRESNQKSTCDYCCNPVFMSMHAWKKRKCVCVWKDRKWMSCIVLSCSLSPSPVSWPWPCPSLFTSCAPQMGFITGDSMQIYWDRERERQRQHTHTYMYTSERNS